MRRVRACEPSDDGIVLGRGVRSRFTVTSGTLVPLAGAGRLPMLRDLLITQFADRAGR